MIHHQVPSASSQTSGFFTETSRFPFSQIGTWLLAVIQSAVDGVLIMDATHQLVLLNDEAERMFGYSADQLLGKPPDILLSPRVRRKYWARMDHFAAMMTNIKRTRKIKFDLQGMRANSEEFPAHATISCVTVGGKNFLVVILRESKIAAVVTSPKPLLTASAIRQRAVSSQHANEVEKRRFSKELYDELGQRLSVLKLDMDWLENYFPKNDKLSLLRVAQMQSLLDNIILRTKNIASSLRPPLLDDFGLLPAITWICENFQKKNSISCDMESTCMAFKLGDPIESTIFRIVQESLSNIERHAQASHVKINLWHTDKEFDVLIQDDGVGMPIGSEFKTGCYGLIAMQERVYTLGGTIKIGNIEPRGVVIHASIPVEPSSFA